MRIFLSGVAGVIGHYVLTALLRQGYDVTMQGFHHSPRLIGHPRLKLFKGSGQEAWARVVATSDVTILLSDLQNGSQIASAHTQHLKWEDILSAAAATGKPRRIIYVRSLGAGPDASDLKQSGAWSVEDAIRRSELDHVILRPSWIFSPRDRTVLRLMRGIRYLPFVSVVGDPDRVVQPVALQNVVEGIVKAVRLPGVASHTYDIAGPRIYTQREIIELLARALGKASARPRYVSGEIGRRLRWLPFMFHLVPSRIPDDVCHPYKYFRDFCIVPLYLEQEMDGLKEPPVSSNDGEQRIETYAGADGTKEW